VVDFRHPLARDVAYLALDPTRARACHRSSASTSRRHPLGRGLSAAIVAATSRAASPRRWPPSSTSRRRRAARNTNHAQLAQRYYHRALSLVPEDDRSAASSPTRPSRPSTATSAAGGAAPPPLALRRLARRAARDPWAALALIRTARLELDEGVLARGLPIAQRAAEIARLAKNARSRSRRSRCCREILRDLGDTQGASPRASARSRSEGRLPAAPARAEVLRAKGVLLRYVGRVREAVRGLRRGHRRVPAVGARRSEARALTSLAFAMFVLERFEDVIALGLESVHRIDLASAAASRSPRRSPTSGRPSRASATLSRGLSYLRRAREAHERYGDQDSRADTLLSTAGILIEAGDVDAAHTLAATRARSSR
jgi:tetratricopeptide (TPR) repeat protein